MFATRLFISAFLIILSASLYPQSQQLTAKLEAIKSNRGVLGMSVTVIKNEGISYSGGFGIRDVARNLPVNDSTIYRIASISKMITAIALLQLYDRGQIDLDADISNYLGYTLRSPHFPNDVVTARKVVSHTASLRDGSGYDGFLSGTFSQNPPPDLRALLLPGGTYYTSDMWSSSKRPNTDYFQYSNVNFGLIGTLIEKISGKRFDVFCRENIFMPLGLDASFNIQDLAGFNNLAVLYRKNGGQWVAQTYNFGGVKPPPRDLSSYVIGTNGVIFGPQGALRISTNDLSKILTMLMNNGVYGGTRILSDTTAARIRQMNWTFTGSNGNNYYGIFNSYSYGLSKTSELLPNQTLYGHPGEAYGLISDAYFSFDNRFGIVFATNGGQWGTGNYSGWYNVEEDVFQACLSELNNLTGLEAPAEVPPAFTLMQNYPNPFNPATTITFTLPEAAFAKLSVFSMTGEEVATLIDSTMSAGAHNSVFRPLDLPSGIYLYRLTVLDDRGRMSSMQRKMVYLR